MSWRREVPLSRRLTLLVDPADVWIGVFFDWAKGRIYVLPVPCIGVIVELRIPSRRRHAVARDGLNCYSGRIASHRRSR